MSEQIDDPTVSPENFAATRRELLERVAIGGVSMTALSALIAACGSSSSSSSAATAASAAGSSTSSSAASAKVQLKGMSLYIPTVTSLNSADRGFKWGTDGLSGQFFHTPYSDIQSELAAGQTFSTVGANAATAYLLSDSSLAPFAQNLATQKIAYANFANRVPWTSPIDPKFNGYFLTSFNGSFAEESYIVTKEMLKRGGGSGDIILLRGAQGSASDNARTYGFQLALKEFPDAKVVATAYTNWDQVTAQQQTATLLTAHPDVKFLAAMNDSIALGGLASLRAANKSSCYVMGCDGDPEYLKNMITDDRVVATAAGRLDHTGVLAAVWLFDWLNGYRLNPLESWINTDSIIVDTPAAAAAMLKLIGFAPAPLPYDPVKMSRHLQGENWQMPHRLQVADPANFDWGSKPGVNHTPKPASFQWPAAYQKALDSGELDTLNAEYAKHLDDVYGPVRAKANYKGTGVLGTFQQLGLT